MAEKTQTNIGEFKEKLEQFEKLAFEISELWEGLPDEASDELAEKYPFQRSFDEEIFGIRAWVENFDEQIKA